MLEPGALGKPDETAPLTPDPAAEIVNRNRPVGSGGFRVTLDPNLPVTTPETHGDEFQIVDAHTGELVQPGYATPYNPSAYGAAFPDTLDYEAATRDSYRQWRAGQQQQAEVQPSGAAMGRARDIVSQIFSPEATPTGQDLGNAPPRFITGAGGEVRGIEHPLAGELSLAEEAAGRARGREFVAPAAAAAKAAGTALAPVGQGIDTYVSRPWKGLMGRALIASVGRTGDFERLVDASLSAKGLLDEQGNFTGANPLHNYFARADAAGELAADLFETAAQESPGAAFVVESLNPVWWTTPIAGAAIGRTLAQAGVSRAVAGMVESAIANGGLPYADVAIGEALGFSARMANAVFINGFTRAAARHAGEAFGDVTDAVWQALPKSGQRFVSEEAGSLNLEAMRGILGLGRKQESPIQTMAALKRIADENDDAALRESILGPGGGFYHAGGQPDRATGKIVGGGGMAPTPELRAHRAQYVDPYRSVYDQFKAATDEIDQIRKGPQLEWGQLSTEEQFRRLAISDPQGKWETYLDAFRNASSEEDRAAIVADARRWGTELETFRQGQRGEIPFGNEHTPLPGDDASEPLARIAVLEATARDLYTKAKELILTRETPQAVEQVFSYRPKMIGDRASTRSFEIVDKQNRIVGTARSEQEVMNRVHELNVARGGEQKPPIEGLAAPVRPSQVQAELPGTPKPQAPSLVLSTQDVSEEAARSARGPAGEQGSLIDAMKAAPTREQQIAAASEEFKRAAGMTAGAPGADQSAIAAKVASGKDLTKLATRAASDAAGGVGPDVSTPRFEVRGSEVYDTKLGKVDDILTAMRFGQRTNPVDNAAAVVKWANKKVTEGTWGEHGNALRPGQKAVPADAQVVQRGEKIVSETPGRPPNEPPKPPAPPRAPTPPSEEGPGQIVTRVIDNKDGTFSLGRVNLEGGMTMSGERFTSRESALITAERRNAEDDVVTMIGDALDGLRNSMEGIPPQHALMSPGQAARVNAEIRAEREAAQAEIASARAAYQRAAEQRGRKLERQFQAQTLRDARTRARGLEAESQRVMGKPPVRGTDEERAIVAERVRESIEAHRASYAVSTPPPPPPPGAPRQLDLGGTPSRSARVADAAGEMIASLPATAAGLSGASRALGTGFDMGIGFRQLQGYIGSHPRVWAYAMRESAHSYTDPAVVEQRVKELWKEVAKYSTGELQLRGLGGEFTGEAVYAPAALEKAPLIGGGILRSNAAFNNGVNLANGRIFVERMKAVEIAAARGARPPATTAETRRLEWVLNKISGRGYDPADLTGGLRVLHEVASLLYSAQWQASRLAMYGELKTTMFNLARLPLGQRLDIADQEVLRWALGEVGTNVLLLGGASVLSGQPIDLDPRSTNFARASLGPPSPQKIFTASLLSALGVGVQTYENEIHTDFSGGMGADLRLAAQLFPIGGDYGFFDGPLGSAKRISATGRESDPFNPQGPFDTNVIGVLADWFGSRGDPRARFLIALGGGRGGDEGLGSRVASAAISAFTPMLLQDAIEASGVAQDWSWQQFSDDMRTGDHWFSTPPTPSPRPTLRPRGSGAPAPAGAASPALNPNAYR